MTNTEAQNLIERNRSVFQYDPEMLEALDKAINALEENEEWHKLKLICANEGIIVYKQRGDV